MKNFALKSVVAAVGALTGVGAIAAAVNLDATGTQVPAKYASEITFTTSQLLNSGTAADLTATAALGASLGQDAVAYVRLDLDATAKFTGNPTLTVANSYNCSTGAAVANAASASVSQVDSNGKWIIFSVSPAAGFCLNSAMALSFDLDTDDQTATNGVTVTDKSTVSLKYRMFETLTNAANPASSNTLKTAERQMIAFAPALTSTVNAGTATAAVGASPSYTAFKVGSNVAVATVNLGNVATSVNTSVAMTNGNAIGAANLLNATSSISLSGTSLFNLAKSDGSAGFDANAKARVYLNTTADCNSANSIGSASTLTADAASFANITAANFAQTNYLCLTAEGTPEISAGDITATVTGAAAAGYAVSSPVSTGKIGTISRDGVRMVAPLVQVPSTGWYVRLALTNTGSSQRDFTVTAVTESGTTINLGSAASGQLAANGTKVIDLHSALTFVGNTRGSLVITVNAPQSEIDGLYQITAPNGSVSNHVLSYKN